MTSSLESEKLRCNRSHAAPFQMHGAPPKIMPQSDISFHNTANREFTDLLMRQSYARLGSRQKNWTTPIPTPESANFSLLTLTPLPAPSVSGLSNVFALYQIIKLEKIRSVFPNVEIILRLFLCLMVTNCSGERSFSKLKRIKSVPRSTMSQERLSDLSILCVKNDKLRLIDFDDTTDEFAARKDRRKMFDNKLPTYRNRILAYHKYVKSLNRLTWKHDNLIIWLFCVNN